MTKKLKIVLITSLALLLVQQTFAQDTSNLLNTSWQTLKTQLSRRANLSNRLVKILEQTKIADTSSVKQLKINTVLLKNLLESEIMDSSTVGKIHDRNDSLSISISKSLGILQNDKSFIPTTEFQDIVMQLKD